LLEYVPDLLFDVCQQLGGIGEGAGRFFMAQLLDVLGYMPKTEASSTETSNLKISWSMPTST
jgi:hypothetical protein